MKKLIFILTTIFALTSYARTSCTSGDISCEEYEANIAKITNASTCKEGVGCKECCIQQEKKDALLSNQNGVLNSASGPVKASDGSSIQTRPPSDQDKKQ